MRATVRLIVATAMALCLCVLLAVTSTLASGVALSATTVLIMGGTGEPDPYLLPDYMSNVESNYLTPFGPCPEASSCNYVSVHGPEQFWPIPGWGGFTGLTFDRSTYEGLADLESAMAGVPTGQPMVVFGYSQSGRISTLAMRDIASGKVVLPPGTPLSFVLIGNISRPNGGMWARLNGLYVPIVDVSFDGATPTSPYRTTDIAIQYDGSTDFPLYPINILADVNALAGFWYLHGTYPGPDPADTSPPPGGPPAGLTPTELANAMKDPANQQAYGNTTYVTIPTKNLPILQPLRDIGAMTGLTALTTPIADLIQPAAKVLIELGYDRSIPYGLPTPARLIPAINPVQVAADLLVAVGKGVQSAFEDVGVASVAPSTPGPATSPTKQIAASFAAPVSSPAVTTDSASSTSNSTSSTATASTAKTVTPTATRAIQRRTREPVTSDSTPLQHPKPSLTDAPRGPSTTTPERKVFGQDAPDTASAEGDSAIGSTPHIPNLHRSGDSPGLRTSGGLDADPCG